MILASISGGQSLGKLLPDLSRQGQSLCEEPFSVSCRKSKPFKPSDAVGFDEKSRKHSPLVARDGASPVSSSRERVLICADSGGSNGYRIRLWKLELQRWANEAGLAVIVRHYPPGATSLATVRGLLDRRIVLVGFRMVRLLPSCTITRVGRRSNATDHRRQRA